MGRFKYYFVIGLVSLVAVAIAYRIPQLRSLVFFAPATAA